MFWFIDFHNLLNHPEWNPIWVLVRVYVNPASPSLETYSCDAFHSFPRAVSAIRAEDERDSRPTAANPSVELKRDKRRSAEPPHSNTDTIPAIHAVTQPCSPCASWIKTPTGRSSRACSRQLKPHSEGKSSTIQKVLRPCLVCDTPALCESDHDYI